MDKNKRAAQLHGFEEASRRLDIRVPTLRKWVAVGKIAHVRLGRRVLIPEAELVRLIEENLVPACGALGSSK
jgi:excisionase family DNA binding protein